ncbi:hypothetical protein, partial [Methylophaga sp.]|uniref:hypothetical protein n=1 Tax=Methylophaga sp. TaxID=2024840 RepID=UPI002716C60F
MILKNTFSALVMFTAAVLILAYQTSVQAKPLIDQRYSDNGDGTITDTKTNLIWQRCSLGQTWTGETCAGYAEGYNWPS